MGAWPFPTQAKIVAKRKASVKEEMGGKEEVAPSSEPEPPAKVPKRKALKLKASSTNGSAEVNVDRERLKDFKGYNLSQLPSEALPFADQTYKGQHSYTIRCREAVPWLWTQFWDLRAQGCAFFFFLF